MACVPIAINQDNEACGGTDGGIRHSYAVDVADIDAITFGTDGEITAITLDVAASFVKFVFDDDDTASFNSEGERTGRKHLFNQTATMKFEGLTTLKVKALNALTNCCNMFWIHRMNSDLALAQGIEAGAGGIFRKAKNTAKPTISIMTDTGENVDRGDVVIESAARTVHVVDLTDAAIEAL